MVYVSNFNKAEKLKNRRIPLRLGAFYARAKEEPSDANLFTAVSTVGEIFAAKLIENVENKPSAQSNLAER
jgi:hypothetical protein